MISEIDKLKHFHIEDYSGIYFTDDLNDDKEVILLCNIVVLKVIKDEEK